MRFITLGFLAVGCAETAITETTDLTTDVAEMTKLRIDFGESDGADWFVLNDDVMGGVSTSEVYATDTTVVFEGEVSTDNNGGFVSFRSPNNEYDLSQYSQIEVSYISEGHDFTMILADQMMWYMPEFKHEVFPIENEWTTAVTSLYDFKQYQMTGYGETETDVEMSDEVLSEVIRLELRNSEFASGAFRLEIDYIEFQGYVNQ